jgi:hypothetical protein
MSSIPDPLRSPARVTAGHREDQPCSLDADSSTVDADASTVDSDLSTLQADIRTLQAGMSTVQQPRRVRLLP